MDLCEPTPNMMAAFCAKIADEGADMTGASQDLRHFYLIDVESETYVVGQIFRRADQVRPELAALHVGETFWSDARWAWERAA